MHKSEVNDFQRVVLGQQRHVLVGPPDRLPEIATRFLNCLVQLLLLNLVQLEVVCFIADACYYLSVEKTRYKFSLRENLNKRFVDRRAGVPPSQIDEEVNRAI